MASAAAAPQQPDAGGSGDQHHDAEVRQLHQSGWCPCHQVVRPRRLVAPDVEDQQQRGRSGRLQQDRPRVTRDAIRVAAARCCGWQRSLPIGLLHRQLLGIGVRPGGCPGPADLPDLVLGGILGVVPGLLPDHAGVQHPPRRWGRELMALIGRRLRRPGGPDPLAPRATLTRTPPTSRRSSPAPLRLPAGAGACSRGGRALSAEYGRVVTTDMFTGDDRAVRPRRGACS